MKTTGRVQRVLTVASAVLLLAVAATWVRSQWYYDLVMPRAAEGHPSAWLRSAAGGLNIQLFAHCIATRDETAWVVRRVSDTGQVDRPARAYYYYSMGFGFDPGVSDWSHALRIPYWFLVIVFVVLPTLWLVDRARQAWRRHAGRCVTCGYDLRATPGSCPECGATHTAAIQSQPPST